MEEFKERFNIEEVEVEDIGGGWNWVGGWMIDKNRYGVDEGGWIRGDTPEDIVGKNEAEKTKYKLEPTKHESTSNSK